MDSIHSFGLQIGKMGIQQRALQADFSRSLLRKRELQSHPAINDDEFLSTIDVSRNVKITFVGQNAFPGR